MTLYRFERAVVLKVLYPLFMLIAAFWKTKKESLQGVIIGMNNAIVKREVRGAKKILLLLPHCLQLDKCDIKLTYNVRNCKACGRCEIKDLIGISDRTGLDLFVATGGTLARRIVMDSRPQAIVAVACERDLSSGIVDTYPMPVLGVPNERPHGPCVNTRVNLELVEQAIRTLGAH